MGCHAVYQLLSGANLNAYYKQNKKVGRRPNSDPVAVKGDATTLEWTRDRFIHVLNGTLAGQINTNLATLRTAANAGAGNLQAAADAAEQLRGIINGL